MVNIRQRHASIASSDLIIIVPWSASLLAAVLLLDINQLFLPLSSSSLILTHSPHLLHQLTKMPRLKQWINDKLVVTAEPGLTNAELMLTNKDLRPGETPRDPP